MYQGNATCTNVTKRRKYLAEHAVVGELEIDSVEEYERMPKIDPLKGKEIYFYEDGIEAVMAQTDKAVRDIPLGVFNHAILVDEGRRQVVRFHYFEERMEEKAEEGRD